MTDFGVLSDAFEQSMEEGKTVVGKVAKLPSDLVQTAAQGLKQTSANPDGKSSQLQQMEENKKVQDQQKIALVKQKLAVMQNAQKRAIQQQTEERKRIAKIQEEILKGKAGKEGQEGGETLRIPNSVVSRGEMPSNKNKSEKSGSNLG